jgi:hypothetical protein
VLTEEFEADLREALFRRAQEVPAEAATRVRRHSYHPRGRRRHVAAGAAIALAVATAATAVAVVYRPAAHQTRATWRLVSDLTQQWQLSRPPSLRNGFALSCPTAVTCYAVVQPFPGPEGVSSPIAIEVTHDGGTTWAQAQLPADVTEASGQFGPIDCLSETTCLTLVSSNSWHYEIVETTDGGQSWAALPGPSALSTEFAVTGGVSCTSATSCVMIGSYAVGTALVGQSFAEVTTDNGSTWTQVAMPSSGGGTVQCFADGNCVTAGAYSTDGGLDWSRASLPSGGGPVWSMSCGDSEDCEASTTPPSGAGVIITTDGGRTWTSAPAEGLTSGAVTTLTCTTNVSCWAAGATLVTPGGLLTLGGHTPQSQAVLESTADQGRTWQPAQLPSGAGLTGVGNVSCSSPDSCFAIGQSSDGLVLLSYGG